MAAKRNSAFFLVILFLSTLLIFSLYNSSLPLSTPSHSSVRSSAIFTPLETPKTDPTYKLTIKVLVYDRLSSLSRCMRSLAAADYVGDKVDLHIYIDHFKLSTDSDADLDRKLNGSRNILGFVDGFAWRFGEKMVHYRTGNVGLQAQWLEAWWPSSDNEFAFVVEDDLEVSPLYYRFIKELIVNFYYNASNFSPWIYGASLQRPRFVPGKHGNKMELDKIENIFLYQLVGTWGQLLFPRPWKEFRLWYDLHKNKGIKPSLQGMVTTGWYKKMGERIWTPWFIQFLHSRGYFNIYTNFLQEFALSVSHRDPGVNYGKTAGPDSQLLINEHSLGFNFLDIHRYSLKDLKWFDFCFRQLHVDRIIRSYEGIQSSFPSIQKLETIVLVNLCVSSEAVPETLVRNLLCHFERLNIQNYVFVGPNSSFLLELARRGHLVIDRDLFFESIRNLIPKKFQESKPETMKEFWVNIFIIKKSLQLKYNIWVLGPDMIPVRNDSFLLDSSFDSNTDLYFGDDTYKALYVRSSSSASKVLKSEDSIFNAVNTYKESGWVKSMAKLFEKYGAKKIDEKTLGVNIISSTVNSNKTSSFFAGDRKKVAFWSGKTDPVLVKKKLEESDLWILDGDDACTSVVCHTS